MRAAKICLGGSFDPVHCGHIETAKALAGYFACPVDLVPNDQPVHRSALVASTEQRMEMLHLACSKEPALHVNSMEIDRHGPSFTIDTLKNLRQQQDDNVPILWCVGMDAFAKLPTWKNWQDLLDFAHLLVLTRPHSALPTSPAFIHWWQQHQRQHAKDLLATTHGHIAQISLPQFAISATIIRQKLKAACVPNSQQLPVEVASYIEKHGLYKSPYRD